MASISNPLFSTLIKSTDNKIGDPGAKSLSDALKSNTTLTELNLRSGHKRNNTQMTLVNNPLFSISIKSTVNNIGETGATSLSDALKSNTTLTELNLNSEHKKKQHTNGIHQQSTLFHSHSNQQTTTFGTQEQHH